MANPSERDAARDSVYCEAYRRWFDSLPADQRRRLAKLGLDKPDASYHAGNDVGMLEDAAMRNEASEWGNPAAAIEGAIEPEEEHEIDDAFSKALAWATQGKTLVQIGQRLGIILHIWKPALLRGLQIEIQRERAADFSRELGEDLADDTGAAGLFLEWLSRGTSLSQWGQRVLAAIYVLRPQLVGAPTLAAIGAHNNKTRQAVDKLVQDFRDTFGGVKSRAMRPDENRKRCKRAQLQRTSRH